MRPTTVIEADMKTISCVLLLVAFALGQKAPKDRAPFTITIAAQEPTVVAGSAVWIRVSIRNLSKSGLDDSGGFTYDGIDPNLRFDVRDENRGPVPRRKQLHKGLWVAGEPVNRTIAPGETFTQEQQVSARFDMRKPGKYFIQVFRRASDNPKDGEIGSNMVTITVVPPLQSHPAIDLTTPPPANQQGRGVPGATGGGTPATPLAPATYPLHLRLTILRVAISERSDFVLEASVQNIGHSPFGLPVSRNITQIEEPTNTGRRVFFFRFLSLPSGGGQPETVGWVATAAAQGLPNSAVLLEPGQSVRVLLRAEADRVRKALPTGTNQLKVRVVCGEWTLQDGRFFLQAEAHELPSVNAATLGFRQGEPFGTVPR